MSTTRDIKQIQAEIRTNIMAGFGIDNLPEDKKEEAINQIGQIIFQGALLRIVPLMEEEDLEEYNQMMSGNPEPDVVMQFLVDKVPTFLDVVADESESFRKQSEDLISKL